MVQRGGRGGQEACGGHVVAGAARACAACMHALPSLPLVMWAMARCALHQRQARGDGAAGGGRLHACADTRRGCCRHLRMLPCVTARIHAAHVHARPPRSVPCMQTETGGVMLTCMQTEILTCMQTETGGVMLTPLPGAWVDKPGSVSLPFFGVVPAVLDPNTGRELEGPCEGVMVIKRAWPGTLRGVHGDRARFEKTYFEPYQGYYFTGDGVKRDGAPPAAGVVLYTMLICWVWGADFLGMLLLHRRRRQARRCASSHCDGVTRDGAPLATDLVHRTLSWVRCSCRPRLAARALQQALAPPAALDGGRGRACTVLVWLMRFA